MFRDLWRDLILVVVGFLLSIVGALIGAWVQRVFDRRGERRPLNKLLNFGADDLLFIFPHRKEINEGILPRTSTEDFMAMNNFISALIKTGWARGNGVRDTERVLPQDKKRNLVVICSPRSNEFAGVLQAQLEALNLHAFSFKTDSEGRMCIIDPRDSDRPPFNSPSWGQEEDYLENGVSRHELPAQSFRDYAVITKVSSPWNQKNKVVWVAGIRGIGTWGAAECIKKRWQQIYAKLPDNAKDADFSALIKVQYDNCDITSTDVQDLFVLRRR